jgi:Type II secretion system (T2SS), protein E, N-terminal domain
MFGFFKPIAWSTDWLARRREGNKRPSCTLISCPGPKPLWHRVLRPRIGTLLHGQFYCSPECLENALMGQISRLRMMAPAVQPPNRIPLGLLMVARGKLTHLEVRAALEAQRRARYGNIGDWIEKLGFASEQDVMAALALQWGCPVASSFDFSADNSHTIPLPILEAFRMIPFNYAASTKTLYLAFGARVDHAALYALEKVLECRTQPCVASPKNIARRLEHLRQVPHPCDVEFFTRDFSEMARITSSYISRVNPDEVRLSRAGRFIWLRLKGRPALTNIVFCLEPIAAQSQPSSTLLPSPSSLPRV